MNVHREGHSSCFIDGKLYVFCGINANKDPINSIELLENACGLLNAIRPWQLIDMSSQQLAPRWMAATAPINDSEIAIVGGLGFDVDIGEAAAMGDVVIFNTQTKATERRVRNLQGFT